MKRTRFSARDRISRDATELARLAVGLAESGSKLEDAWWENRLAALVDRLLEDSAEDDLNAALDRLYDSNPTAHDELADAIEARAESCRLTQRDQEMDVLLIAVPILAWSRFTIPAAPIPASGLHTLGTQLAAHTLAGGARLALADFLFSPDQMPRTFVDTRELTQALGEAALAGRNLSVDTATLAETNAFLSDVRYLIGAVVVPRGGAIFRWNEADGTRENALKEWKRQGSPSLEPLLAGCAWQPLPPDAYHSACHQSDRASRPYSLRASVAFLQTILNVQPDQLRAVVGPFHDRRLEEYRVGFSLRDKPDVVHGVVWPLLGADDETTEATAEIEDVLRECGVKDVVILEQRFPFEFCDDCGAPLYPNGDGEAVHAELPEERSEPATRMLH